MLKLLFLMIDPEKERVSLGMSSSYRAAMQANCASSIKVMLSHAAVLETKENGIEVEMGAGGLRRALYPPRGFSERTLRTKAGSVCDRAESGCANY